MIFEVKRILEPKIRSFSRELGNTKRLEETSRFSKFTRTVQGIKMSAQDNRYFAIDFAKKIEI
ncbi:MAG: hypothetical protein Tsb0021_17930 [Chlamydiales bacterium]